MNVQIHYTRENELEHLSSNKAQNLQKLKSTDKPQVTEPLQTRVQDLKPAKNPFSFVIYKINYLS